GFLHSLARKGPARKFFHRFDAVAGVVISGHFRHIEGKHHQNRLERSAPRPVEAHYNVLLPMQGWLRGRY
ncbi:hypothetical protein, partial [Pseudomonas syringae group genomosp. 3]|uniref:hypothetical protein n=1 Tax=Pseudomonas syringae group genomosp. 3 TaxID=251701 RepID=UPI001C3F26AE